MTPERLSAERLSAERLAEIREHADKWERRPSTGELGTSGRHIMELLDYIDAQQAEIDHLRAIAFDSMLGRRIQSLEAEIDRLASQVAALREAVPTAHKGDCPTLRKPWLPYDESACECGRRRNLELLADTEAAAREHDRRLRLEGAREFVRRYEDQLAHTIAPTSVLKQKLAEMEREAGQ